MMALALVLAGASCNSRVTSPPTPAEKAQPSQPDTRPNPTPPEMDRATPGESAGRASASADLVAYAAARPALEKHCFRCHTSAGQKAKAKTLKHLSFDQYPPTGHHAHEAATVFRRVLVGNKARGKGPTMPADDRGAVTGEDLEKILAWAEAFDRARGDHGHHTAP